MAIRIFCCHDDTDEMLLNKLKKKLKPLENKGLIKVYDKRDIPRGTVWQDEMDRHLQTSQIILLLFSNLFIQSADYDKIQKQAMEQHNLGKAIVVPVILYSSSWRQTSFGGITPLPTKGIPITSTQWRTEDEAFFDVVDGIHKIASGLTKTSPMNPPPLPLVITPPVSPVWNVPTRILTRPQFPTKVEDIVLRQTFSEHLGGVGSIAISSDGLYLASGSNDGTIKLGSLSAGQFLSTLAKLSGGVMSVAISRDGQLLASGSDEKEIHVWYLPRQQLLPTLTGHTASVTSVAISPNGKTLASGSEDKTVHLWSLDTGRSLHRFVRHSRVVLSVVFSPNGQMLASGSADKTINIWDLQNGECLYTLKEHSKEVLSIAISPNGKTLASGSEDKTIKLWDLDTGKVIRTLKGHSKGVFSVAISPDGLILASGSEDGTIKLWNLLSAELYCTLAEGHLGGVWSVSFSLNGQILVSGGEDGLIKVWGRK
jgi:tricorn protease-like protein